jgi:hypothetical protein
MDMKYVARLNADGTALIPTQKKSAIILRTKPPLAPLSISITLKHHVFLREEDGSCSWWLTEEGVKKLSNLK